MASAVALRLALVSCLASLALVPCLTAAAINAYLTIPGVPGPSTSQPGSIDVLSFSIGTALQTVTTTTGRRDERVRTKPTFSDLTVMKVLDSTSPVFEQAVASGQRFPTVVLSYAKAVGDKPSTYFTITLTNVIVTSFQLSGSNENPTESVSFTYGAIHTVFTPQRPDGTPGTPIEACWDVVQDRSCL